jgi:hypothetical protein
MAITVLAAITDQGRAAFAAMTVNGTSFIVTTFECGNGGHDPGNPIVALTPDTSLGELPQITFGPEPIDEASLPDDLYTPEFDCFLQQNEAVGELSNIGLLGYYPGETDDGSPNDVAGKVGEYFLFAIGNFPLRVKVDTEVVEFTVSVIF